MSRNILSLWEHGLLNRNSLQSETSVYAVSFYFPHHWSFYTLICQSHSIVSGLLCYITLDKNILVTLFEW